MKGNSEGRINIATRKNLQPHFPPGKGVQYADTGYNLLGLIIESLTSKPYHEVLQEYIFNPLRMQHTYLSHYSEPKVRSKHPTAHLYMGKLKISVEEYRSFSSFYAGGQTVSTTEDLLVFMNLW
ncbi:serine hydrolase domain-containing protein [Paenibacillus fonticola]|uniref:serine hydrolase domain-containing protein n=1 Tax=Paenibacillus fonticola TaxID=379896 RepID=UPI001F0A3396|nr:serine hydrolase domain-containing protein [Paenibacillus fonticola]